MSRGQKARVVLLKDAQNGGQAAAARGGYEVGEGVLGVSGLVVGKHDCCQRLRRQQGRRVPLGRGRWQLEEQGRLG